jgi:competence CoiA-like predicted nuclease
MLRVHAVRQSENSISSTSKELKQVKTLFEKVNNDDYHQKLKNQAALLQQELTNITKENAHLSQKNKQLERLIEHKARRTVSQKEQCEKENLRSKLDYFRAKIEAEKRTLAELARKKADAFERKGELVRNENKFIQYCREKHGVDFDDEEHIKMRQLEEEQQTQRQALEKGIGIAR